MEPLSPLHILPEISRLAFQSEIILPLKGAYLVVKIIGNNESYFKGCSVTEDIFLISDKYNIEPPLEMFPIIVVSKKLIGAILPSFIAGS